ncbi:uncharacterized protein LOC124286489 [Haliotis rubra]|uniref:uncharacterized protein LOC124286489 n=1 Tax=Haliotis rubra TaxID=36100 RepID=UPI001EE4F40A|nr:uncharacterized protein LOC124286489 [Haliotis rubra]
MRVTSIPFKEKNLRYISNITNIPIFAELQPLKIVLPVSACLLLLVGILCGLLLKRARQCLNKREEFSYPSIRGMDDSTRLPNTESERGSCQETGRVSTGKSSPESVQCEVTEGNGSEASDEKQEGFTYTWSYGSTPNSFYSVVARAVCPDLSDPYVRHEVWGTTLGGQVTGTTVTDTGCE